MLSQKTVDEKSNEIPAMRELLKLIDIRGCMVTADALHCQIETGEAIINAGRIEIRTAFVLHDVSWMTEHLSKWTGLSCIGAINRKFAINAKTSDEWHYYISSRKLTPGELLHYARNEWTIESMHWLLDVHFREDYCRIRDSNSNQVMNIVRKIVLNYLRTYKKQSGIKKPFSRMMFACLLDCNEILKIINW